MPPITIVSVKRDTIYQISYKLSNGEESAFRVAPEMASFIMSAWGTVTLASGIEFITPTLLEND